jgi:hypothetical protein
MGGQAPRASLLVDGKVGRKADVTVGVDSLSVVLVEYRMSSGPRDLGHGRFLHTPQVQ